MAKQSAVVLVIVLDHAAQRVVPKVVAHIPEVVVIHERRVSVPAHGVPVVAELQGRGHRLSPARTHVRLLEQGEELAARN